jgi:sugar lactone lactonase YvrE
MEGRIMKSRKTVAALAVFAALLITSVAGVAMTPATASAAPGVNTLAGAPGTAGTVNATGTAARFMYPRGVAVDSSGNVYVADTNASVIRKITPAGDVTTFAGTPKAIGFVDGTGAAARFNYPEGIAVDAAGNVYVADTQNNAIRLISTAGVVSTLSGQPGVGGFGGWVDGNVSRAMFLRPRGVCVATNGIVYVGDSGNNAVRKITTAGVVSTLAGGVGVLNNPRGVAVDTSGNVYVADFSNHRIARVTALGVVSTWAGLYGVSGSLDGASGAARFSNPDGLTRTAAGDLYVGDSGNNTIRAISAGRAVTTFAGCPPPSAAGSTDGINTAARFNDPRGVAVDTAGTVYVADRGNSTIRMTVATVITITASAGANGSITPGGVIGVPTSVNSTTFTITPSTGYHIVDVLVDGVSVGAVTSYTFSSVTANHTIAASFAVGWVITPSAGANGSISPATPVWVAPGGSQSFTTTPHPGYHVLNVLVDGGSVGAVTTYTFTNVTANHTISASFAINTYTLAPSAGPNGTISPNTTQTVNYGASQTFTMTANAGYHVLDVLVDSVSQGPLLTYQFTNVALNHTISATFEANPVISVTAPATPATYSQGGTLPVTWTTNTTVSVGQFGIWLVSPGNIWKLAKVVPANGAGTSYADSVVWNVAAGVGYQVYVYYRATPTSPWGNYGVASGAITITATFSPINVTAPSIPASYARGATLPVTWTTNWTVSSGEFGIWIVSPGNIWTLGKVVPANGASTNYSDSVVLNVATGVGYQSYVYYRATSVSPWSIYGLAPGATTVI